MRMCEYNDEWIQRFMEGVSVLSEWDSGMC